MELSGDVPEPLEVGTREQIKLTFVDMRKAGLVPRRYQ